MGLLDGDLAESIYAGFKGRLIAGALRRILIPESGALDRLGDAIDVAPEDLPIEGFTEHYSAAFRAKAGIPQTDLNVCFFAATISGIRPLPDWQARLGSKWYQLRAVDTDPATALWTCQSFEIPPPQ